MQTNTMFFVIDFGFDKDKMTRICGAFSDYSSALAHANSLREQYGDQLRLDVIPGSMMVGNKKERECESFDYRRHVAFDIAKMEIPMKCDICLKNANSFLLFARRNLLRKLHYQS
ncbi:hypothetical protein [Nitrosopumilus sp.]|uniref:hypothetical protein n=1 Tax=Nitrosopumilus sp. TaxID=2024843 RepID=UPI0029310480|nr:hypothetical protein [Nitrosopumilus sp.]